MEFFVGYAGLHRNNLKMILQTTLLCVILKENGNKTEIAGLRFLHFCIKNNIK